MAPIYCTFSFVQGLAAELGKDPVEDKAAVKAELDRRVPPKPIVAQKRKTLECGNADTASMSQSAAAVDWTEQAGWQSHVAWQQTSWYAAGWQAARTAEQNVSNSAAWQTRAHIAAATSTAAAATARAEELEGKVEHLKRELAAAKGSSTTSVAQAVARTGTDARTSSSSSSPATHHNLPESACDVSTVRGEASTPKFSQTPQTPQAATTHTRGLDPDRRPRPPKSSENTHASAIPLDGVAVSRSDSAVHVQADTSELPKSAAPKSTTVLLPTPKATPAPVLLPTSKATPAPVQSAATPPQKLTEAPLLLQAKSKAATAPDQQQHPSPHPPTETETRATTVREYPTRSAAPRGGAAECARQGGFGHGSV